MKKKKEIQNIPQGDTLPINPPPRKQLLNEEAEEYLRESGNIEDLPNPEEGEQTEILIKQDKPVK